MPKTDKMQRGLAAESVAADFLAAQGLKILARNLACRAGELDVVCLDGPVLVIAEVRQRSRGDFGGALASVTWRKQRRLVRATQFHWQRRPEWRALLLRFDVVAVGLSADGAPEVIWVKDAFRAQR